MSAKGIKAMILGVQVMILGGFIMIDPSSNLGGFEFLLLIIGLSIGIFGFQLNE